MMQPRNLPTDPTAARSPARRPSVPRPPLSVVHAGALYRPVPPVEFDDDGYPGPDGRMSESITHGRWLNHGLDAAQALLDHLPGTLVASDLALLFEKGNPAAVVSPDLVVVPGAGPHQRNSYKLWEEGILPTLALEALSEKTWRNDVEVKPGLYRDLGIHEFWHLDPIGVLPAPVVGYRLRGGIYVRIPTSPSGGVPSDVLGAELFVDGDDLRFRDRRTGNVLPDYLHSNRARRTAEAAQAQEAVARQTAEERLRNEALARQTAEVALEQESVARRTAEASRHAAEARMRHEVLARTEAERRVAELEKQLRQQER